MLIDNTKLGELTKQYGDAFYLLDTEQFKQNFTELKTAFSEIYNKFNIAYSYKTNYTPELCKIIDSLGGYAEVVSDMEMEIALKIGVEPKKIIWNGPYKNKDKMIDFLLMGGTINIDSVYEFDIIRDVISKNPDSKINVGIRCNFDIDDNVLSRFGIDVESDEFKEALELVRSEEIHFTGLQCHFATRSLKTWKTRVKKMLELINSLNIIPEHIDLGGGLYGKMQDSLKAQFDCDIPTYKEYAKEVATIIEAHYKNLSYDEKPLVLIEPGSALVGDCMKFASKVVNIKNIRGKNIATLLGSIYNINPTLNKKNPPITVYNMGGETKEYTDLDFGGFTCIESDYVYKGYKGKVAQGDMVIFGNAGSYSIVLKPPFILPNFPVIDICGDEVKVIKRQENFDDLFHTFIF